MFSAMKKDFQDYLEKTIEPQAHLFVTSAEPDILWQIYLDSFLPEHNPIFRERREHDCSGCKKFIRNFGNVVIIDGEEFISIWDFIPKQEKYQLPFQAMADYVHQCKVTDVFLTKERKQGQDKDHEQVGNDVITWDHFYFRLPKHLVFRGIQSELNKKRAEYRDIRNVFLRSLTEITSDAVDTVLELISQNTLYKGEEWKGVLQNFQAYQQKMKEVGNLFTWSWQASIKAGPVIGKLRNHSIGVLLQDISNGVDLNDAVRRYEKIVAPTNYKRPKAIFTKKMIQQAQETVVQLGLENSLGRRHAVIEDITVNNILFANKDSIKRMASNLDVFDDLFKEVSDKLPNLDRIENIDINTFIADVLPKLTEVNLLMENRMEPNLVSLIAPINSDASTMFKWTNLFSWAYNGNITDSMKERVSKAGGNINGVLRFSIMWNEDGDNGNDFDAHAVEPNNNLIHYPSAGQVHRSSGILDVDITLPFDRQQVPDGGAAVENIVWTDINRMPDGQYTFYVHNYSHNGGKSGFSAEVEFNNIIHQLSYNKELRQNEKISVAEVILKDGKFQIKPLLQTSTTGKTIWNISTQKFHPISTIMFSPNYWDQQTGIGHRHVFFMVNDCLNDSQPNGFFNEFLSENLMQHKRVFEALGSKMHVKDSQHQLSGVGFSTTKRNYVVLQVKGTFNRTIKVTF